jgi:hypothetical protein
LQQASRGVACAADQRALHDMSSSKTIITLHNIVAEFLFGNEILRLVNTVYTAQRHTPILVVTSVTTISTTKKVSYTYQLNNCQMMVLQSIMIVVYFYSFVTRIMTCFFFLPMMILTIQQLTAKMHVSIQSNIHFGQ